MCGITGIWSVNGDNISTINQTSEAVARLRHRGPDDSGIWSNDHGVVFGHTRLSILDLSNFGHQPMISDDERQVIVFNGEIYNFRSIRRDLESKGHKFLGSGDTEVILHAFKEWGSSAVDKFIGMFAFAFWDEQEKNLELVRDRIGVKPLYYGWDGKNLCFGSELKALLAYKHWTPEIDVRTLGEFLQYGYIADNRTIFKNIFKLRPGHRLSLRQSSQPKVERYWSVIDQPSLELPRSEEEIEQQLEALLVEAFQYRTVSDVPVGVYLSGGVDSSLVTALLAKHSNKSIQTYTIGFTETAHDESGWARKVSECCGTNHTEYILGVSDALDIAKSWGDLFDEPFGDSSGIPTLLVSRLARNDVKVVLSADGGDELFSGYDVYTSVLTRFDQIRRYPAWMRKMTSTALSSLPKRMRGTTNNGTPIPPSLRGDFARKADRLRRILSDPSPGHIMDTYMSYWYPSEIKALIGAHHVVRPAAGFYPGNPVDQLSLWDFNHYLPEDILTKVDRTTMAVGIEGREPLLDHRIAEFAFQLPTSLRRGRNGPKHILKSILYKHVPRSLVDRPKQGFRIPLEKWLRTDMKNLVTDYLDENRIKNAGLMDSKLVQEVTRNFYEGDSSLTSPLWFLVAFEMWRERWG